MRGLLTPTTYDSSGGPSSKYSLPLVDIYLSATHHLPADAESLAQLDPSRTTDVDAYP